MATFNKSMGINSLHNQNFTSTQNTAVNDADTMQMINALPLVTTPTNGDFMSIKISQNPGIAVSHTYTWTYTGGVWTSNFSTYTGALPVPSPLLQVPPFARMEMIISVASGTKFLGTFGTEYKNFVN